MKQSDLFFKIGKFETYIVTFKNDGNYYDEYIHCIVKEHIEVNYEKAPVKIKVLQIHNLKDYIDGDKSNTSERILLVDSLKPIITVK